MIVFFFFSFFLTGISDFSHDALECRDYHPFSLWVRVVGILFDRVDDEEISILTYGHSTHETEGARDHCILRSIIGWKGQDRPSAHHPRRSKGPKKIMMDEKSTWILTWRNINNGSWFAGKLRQVHLQEVRSTYILTYYVRGTVFGWESRVLTSTWSWSLACVWSGPYVSIEVDEVTKLHRFV